MIQAAADAVRDWQRESGQLAGEPGSAHQDPIMLAVTVLTSIDQHQLEQELLIAGMTIQEVAVRMAKMAQTAGAGGVICSPHEIAPVRAACGPDFKIVTPGIRPVWHGSNDQKRITTPADAVRLGADYIVIGRPITLAPHPASAAVRIVEELEDTAY